MQTTLTTASELFALLPRVTSAALSLCSMPLGHMSVTVSTEHNAGTPRNALGSVFLTLKAENGMRLRLMPFSALRVECQDVNEVRLCGVLFGEFVTAAPSEPGEDDVTIWVTLHLD